MTPPDIFLVSEQVSDLLRDLELHDTVLSEIVNLNDFIPSLPGSAPAPRFRQSRKGLIDPSSITNASITKVAATRAPTDDSKAKEKARLLAQITQLEANLEEKTRENNRLEKDQADLEQQLADQRTRSRIGSRSRIASTSVMQPSDLKGSATDADVELWKSRYEDMAAQYQALHAETQRKNGILRVSALKSHPIPRPTVPRAASFEGGDET
jgi:hypothetical protein